MKLMRDVPIVGWDVAFTDKGVYLLEVCACVYVVIVCRTYYVYY